MMNGDGVDAPAAAHDRLVVQLVGEARRAAGCCSCPRSRSPGVLSDANCSAAADANADGGNSGIGLGRVGGLGRAA